MKPLKMFKVDWQDITTQDEWSVVEQSPIVNCTSIGYLIHKDKDSLTLSATVSFERNMCCQRIRIPTGCVTSRIPIDCITSIKEMK